MKRIFNPLRSATVLRVYTHANEVRADVRTNDGGFYEGVPFMIQGGGASAYQYTAPTVYSDVLLLFPDGPYTLPYIIGGQFVSTLPEEEAEIIGDADYSPSNKDTVLSRDSSTLSLSESGITQSAPTVRIQLPSGGVLRISLEGETSDSPLNGQAFIDAIFPWIIGTNTKVNAMLTALGPIATSLVATLTASGDIVQATQIEANMLIANSTSVPDPTTVQSNAESTINTTVKLP